MKMLASTLLLALLSLPVSAGEARVTGVEARLDGDGWRFDVTVAHGDTGWDHYADAWQVLAPDGTVLGTRELLHPHVDEQPFTRSLDNVAVPADLDRVMVRARDSVHGWGAAFEGVLPR